jgi:hypothetical protein
MDPERVILPSGFIFGRSWEDEIAVNGALAVAATSCKRLEQIKTETNAG